MIKIAIEMPDNPGKWEDAIADYVAKHYPYINDGIAAITFMKKEETTHDGVGEIEYKKGGINISIPVIVDNGNLLEPNIGIHDSKAIPINEDIVNWIGLNAKVHGDPVERNTQNNTDMDFIQQTGLYEEDEYSSPIKTSCYHTTLAHIQKHASKHKELDWLTKKLGKAAGLPTQRVVAENINELHNAGSIDKIAHIIWEDAITGKLSQETTYPFRSAVHDINKSAHVSESPYVTQEIAFKYAGEDIEKKYAKTILIANSEDLGDYDSIPVIVGTSTHNASGTVGWEVEPIIPGEKRGLTLAAIKIKVPQEPSPVPNNKNSEDLISCDEDNNAIAFGELYGDPGNYRFPKKDKSYHTPSTEDEYNIGDTVIVRLGEGKYSYPYTVGSKTSIILTPSMKNVYIVTLKSVFANASIDAIVSSNPEFKREYTKNIKNTQITNQFRGNNTSVLFIPEADIKKLVGTIYRPGKKENMLKEIIGSIPNTDMSARIKTANNRYIVYPDTNTQSEPIELPNKDMAEKLAQYFAGHNTTIPTDDHTIHYTLSKKAQISNTIRDIIHQHTPTYLSIAANIDKHTSQHFNKVANIKDIVNDLIGISFIDGARDIDTNKLNDKLTDIVSMLGNLILLARLGKVSVPESDMNRAFWSLADLMKVLRG